MTDESIVVFLRAQIGEYTSKLREAAGETEQMGKRGGAAFGKLQSVGKAALAGLASVAIAGGLFAIKLADSWEQARARLSTAIANTGQPLSAFKGQIDALDSSFTKYGYNSSQTEDALARLTQATNDPKKALADMAVAANLAAARHIDLETAATIVGKVAQGNTGILKRYGIDLGVAAGGALKVKSAHDAVTKASEALDAVQQRISSGSLKGVAASQALARAQEKLHDAQSALTDAQHAGELGVTALSDKTKGSAAAAADTFGGKLASLEAQLQNLAIKIGVWLIPIIERLADDTHTVVDWFGKHHAATVALAAVIGGVLVTAIAAYVAGLVVGAVTAIAGAISGTIAFTTALYAQAVAMVAAYWPILLIIAGLALLVVAIYELVTHWHTVWNAIKSAASAAWSFLKGIFNDGLNWVKGAWDTAWGAVKGTFDQVWSVLENALRVGVTVVLPAILTGGLSILVKLFIDHFSQIKSFVSGIVDDIVGFFTGLPGRILSTAAALVTAAARIGLSILAGISKGIGAAVSFVADFAKGLANGVIGFINTHVIDSIDSAIGGIGINTPLFSWTAPKHLLPDIPTFDRGGIVPGTTGSPQLILAHGGETILPTHRGALSPAGGSSLVFAPNVKVDVAGTSSNAADIRAAVLEGIRKSGRELEHTLGAWQRSNGRAPSGATAR